MTRRDEEELSDVTADMRRRQRHLRAPQKMADVLSRLMARRGYAQVQTANAFAEAWREAAGMRLAPHSRAGNMRRGVLEVTVRNSAVMQELSFQKKKLVQRLVKLLPDQKIRDVKFRVGVIE